MGNGHEHESVLAPAPASGSPRVLLSINYSAVSSSSEHLQLHSVTDEIDRIDLSGFDCFSHSSLHHYSVISNQ